MLYHFYCITYCISGQPQTLIHLCPGVVLQGIAAPGMLVQRVPLVISLQKTKPQAKKEFTVADWEGATSSNPSLRLRNPKPQHLRENFVKPEESAAVLRCPGPQRGAPPRR